MKVVHEPVSVLETEDYAGLSRPLDSRLASSNGSGSSARSNYDSGEDDSQDEHEGGDGLDPQQDGLEHGMDPAGFSGATEKIVKPLTQEALVAFKAAQDQAGIIYISRIPPGMRPTKVRHLMSQYGEIGKVYLQQEGKQIFL
jgi:ESF2/ABP1 family protein